MYCYRFDVFSGISTIKPLLKYCHNPIRKASQGPISYFLYGGGGGVRGRGRNMSQLDAEAVSYTAYVTAWVGRNIL